MMQPFKERFLAFLGRMLSVTLGIVITFTVQGILDRQRDKRSVKSALELVRTELSSNLDDIAILTDYFRQERASAKYLSAHKKDLAKCPADSVNYHVGMVNADVSVAFSHDALELLKMSTLFPKIKDNDLSMKIIRAYDACELMASNVNRHVSLRDAATDGSVGWLLSRPANYTWFMDPADIQEAVDAIDSFLQVK